MPGESVFKLRIIFTETQIFFELNGRYSVFSGFAACLLHIIQEKTSLLQDSIVEMQRKLIQEKETGIFENHQHKNGNECQDILI